MEALLDPGATPVATNLQEVIDAATAAEQEAAKKARTDAALRNVIGGPARTGTEESAIAATVPDSDADSETDILMASG